MTWSWESMVVRHDLGGEEPEVGAWPSHADGGLRVWVQTVKHMQELKEVTVVGNGRGKRLGLGLLIIGLNRE